MSPVQNFLQMLGVKPVRHKPTKVMAAVITEANVHDLAEWIRYETGDFHAALVYSHEVKVPEVHDISRVPRLHIKCDKGQSRIADLGDVLIRGINGEFYAITYEVYANAYEDIPQEA